MIKVADIFTALEKAAPISLAADFDNPGFLVGHSAQEVTKVLVALDITSDVIDEAKECGANLIVAHHPIIFTPRKSITDGDGIGAILLKLIENNIAAICMHTNLDAARGGVNDVFAEVIGIKDIRPVEPLEDGSVGLGRYGELSEEMPMPEFLSHVCKKLETKGVRYYDAKVPVRKVILGGGACGEYVEYARKLGCDTVVTADIKHDKMLLALELSVNVIDGGHFATENIVCPRICEIIKERFPELSVSVAENNVDAVSYFTV